MWQFACRVVDACANLASFWANGTKKLQVLQKTLRWSRRAPCTGDGNVRQNTTSACRDTFESPTTPGAFFFDRQK
jgi:hypothetical protein